MRLTNISYSQILASGHANVFDFVGPYGTLFPTENQSLIFKSFGWKESPYDFPIINSTANNNNL